MPDPNKRKPRLTSRKKADASKTPKVRKDDKFTGSQGKYSREFMPKVQHNQMTNDRQGTAKYRTKADQNGLFVKRAKFSGRGSFPGVKESYKGGMEGAGPKVPIAQNTR